MPYQVTVLAVLVLIAYWNSLDASFHFDDFALLSDPYITGPGLGWGVFRPAQTRPLTYLTFHWNYLVGGQNPGGYHWLNVWIHVFNCALVLAVARRHLPVGTAMLSAALFAVHPLQTEAVTYVFCRSSLLSGRSNVRSNTGNWWRLILHVILSSRSEP